MNFGNVKKVVLLLIGVIMITMAVVTTGCENGQTSAEKKNSQWRDEIYKLATKAVDVPKIEHFLNRKAISEYMNRMDKPSKTFYVYLLLDDKPFGYYVTRTHPLSVCALMTPPDKIFGDTTPAGALTTRQAPTLDGTYYGGDGEMCTHYYAFTADTNTMVEWSCDFFISDRPLPLDAPKLHPKDSKQKKE